MKSSLCRDGWFLVALILPLPATVLSAAAAAPEPSGRLVVQFEDAPLSEVLDYFRSRFPKPDGSPRNFILDAGVDPATRVTLQLRKVPPGIAFVHAIDQAGLLVRIEPHACLVLPNPDRLPAGAPPDQLPSATRKHAARAAQIMFDRVDFDQAPLGEVVAHLSRRSAELDPEGIGANLVLSRRVDAHGPVTLTALNVPLSEVLVSLRRITGLELRQEPHAIFLDPPGTRALRLARAKPNSARPAPAAATAAPEQAGARGRGYSIGEIPKDPRSPAHPDYVESTHPDIRKRTNALNNVYKWVNGKWTFVRYGSGDPKAPTLDGKGRRLVTPSLDAR